MVHLYFSKTLLHSCAKETLDSEVKLWRLRLVEERGEKRKENVKAKKEGTERSNGINKLWVERQ